MLALAKNNKVQDDKTYHVMSNSTMYHYIRSQVKDRNGTDYMWIKLKEVLPDEQIIVLGYVSRPIVQMAIDKELEQRKGA